MIKMLKRGELLGWAPTVVAVKLALRDAFKGHPLGGTYRQFDLMLSARSTDQDCSCVGTVCGRRE